MKPLNNGLKEAFGLLLISFSPGTLEKVKRQQKEDDTKEAVKSFAHRWHHVLFYRDVHHSQSFYYSLRDG
jgi:hypothetical protein